MIYDTFKSKQIGELTLAADEQGIRYIKFEKSRKPYAVTQDWVRDPGYFKKAKEQLTAYFNGEPKTFELPLAPEGTPFQKSVWKVMQKIPYGKVRSYQWVADQIKNPKAVRAVGGAAGRNPIVIAIPCHRVIGSNGKLTGFGGGLDVKQTLIDLEKRKA